MPGPTEEQAIVFCQITNRNDVNTNTTAIKHNY